MEQKQFEDLVKTLCQQDALPAALEMLKSCDDEQVASAAQELTGQFALAEVDGERRIYHVTVEQEDDGSEKEYVEHVMNEGEEVIRFVAWFFDSQFGMKRKDIYQMAGKTYRQPKR
ncbi:hypothetical protein [Vibrio sp.]|uniref:hypothetical protein n=1 Tax=Vibrio sp. TaxID=678 RepID=UPI003D0CA66F